MKAWFRRFGWLGVLSNAYAATLLPLALLGWWGGFAVTLLYVLWFWVRGWTPWAPEFTR